MTTKAELKALERIFVAEINGHLPLQSKAKIYERMEADGLVQRDEKRFRDIAIDACALADATLAEEERTRNCAVELSQTRSTAS